MDADTLITPVMHNRDDYGSYPSPLAISGNVAWWNQNRQLHRSDHHENCSYDDKNVSDKQWTSGIKSIAIIVNEPKRKRYCISVNRLLYKCYSIIFGINFTWTSSWANALWIFRVYSCRYTLSEFCLLVLPHILCYVVCIFIFLRSVLYCVLLHSDHIHTAYNHEMRQHITSNDDGWFISHTILASVQMNDL